MAPVLLQILQECLTGIFAAPAVWSLHCNNLEFRYLSPLLPISSHFHPSPTTSVPPLLHQELQQKGFQGPASDTLMSFEKVDYQFLSILCPRFFSFLLFDPLVGCACLVALMAVSMWHSFGCHCHLSNELGVLWIPAVCDFVLALRVSMHLLIDHVAVLSVSIAVTPQSAGTGRQRAGKCRAASGGHELVSSIPPTCSPCWWLFSSARLHLSLISY